MEAKDKSNKHYYTRKVILNHKLRGVLETKQAFQRKLELLYTPVFVGFKPSRVTNLFNHYLGLRAKPYTTPTHEVEVQRLIACVQLPSQSTYCDVFAGTCGIRNALSKHLGIHVTTNDISQRFNTDYHFDAISPGSWPKALSNVDVMVTSPPYELLDIIVPDLYGRCKQLTALHVSGDFISNAPKYRQSFIGKLQHEDKVALVYGLENCNGRRCAWLLLFKTAKLKKRLCKQVSTISTYLDFVVEESDE